MASSLSFAQTTVVDPVNQALKSCKETSTDKMSFAKCMKEKGIERSELKNHRENHKEEKLDRMEKRSESLEQRIQKHKDFESAAKSCKETSKSKEDFQKCLETAGFKKPEKLQK